jgi:DNA-directed DNA polymerase III PolC
MYLNCHTFYSLRYGTISIEELVNYAVENGVKKLALTDINTTSAVFDFVELCRKVGIEPVVGVEFRNEDDLLYLCLAKSHNGFVEINTFRTEYHLAKKDFPEIPPVFENVIVIFPFLKRSKLVLYPKAKIGIRLNELTKLYKIDFQDFVLLQPITFFNKRGHNIHRLLRAIDKNSLLSKLPKSVEACEDEIFYSEEILRKSLASYPELIVNTENILAQCSFEFDFHRPKNKEVYTTSKVDDLALLKKITYDGLLDRYGLDNVEAKKRIENELKVISELSFCSYFLITHDIIRYARSRGYFHIGRGSGANSIVAYCIGITDVDPIELDLYFERFINPSRTSPPDFDIDFSWDERDEIIDYIFKRYGANYVCLLATYVTFKDRSAYRELGKVFGLPKPEIDALVDNRRTPQNGEYIDLIMKYGKLMEDFPNYLSIHAGGIMISEQPLSHYTALQPMPKGFPICEFDMYVCEDIGFSKFDVLSQRGLGHIKESVDIIWQNRQVNVDVHAIQKFKTDPKIQAQLKSKETTGCFYIESPAMKQLIWKLECDNYLTLVAASSIIRPGVASSGMMAAFIKYHHKPAEVVYIHPKMKELLEETYGVMVYQEDVIKVAHHFAGLTLAEADVLRRAMSGKYRSKAEFEKIVEKFHTNCQERGYPEEIYREVWRQIQSFAGYSFSKAHSASYAVESYQSLYLKTYYPLEFMVAVINNFGGFYRTEFYVHEAKRAGAIVELPEINSSEYMTSICGIVVSLGFIHVKSLESKLIKAIVEERKNGSFFSFEQFCKRVPAGLEQLIILIRIGAFRLLGESKKELLWKAHLLVNGRKLLPVMSEIFEIEELDYSFPELLHSELEDAYDEFELLGFPLCSPYNMLFEKVETYYFAKNFHLGFGKTVEMLGYLITLKPTWTKKGERMAFGYFVDKHGEYFDTVHFPKSLAAFPFRGGGIYHLRGKVTEEFGHFALQVTWMNRLAFMVDPRNG